MLPNFDPYRLGPHGGGLDVVGAARQAEELGFDAVWVGDHLSFHPPVLEATLSMAAAAVATRHIKVGSAVLLGPMRQPVWLAKQVQTLHHLAPGRVLLGLGVGGEHPPEWRAAGAEVSGRGARLDTLLEVLPLLLAGKRVRTGAPLWVDTPPLEPAVPTPPIIIGGRSPAAVRRAARFGDGWMTVWMDPDRIAVARQELIDQARRWGRPAPEVSMVIFVAVGDDGEQCRQDAARLFSGQYALPWEAVEGWTVTGSVAAVADQLATYQQAGVEGFVIIPSRPDHRGQMEELAAVRVALGD